MLKCQPGIHHIKSPPCVYSCGESRVYTSGCWKAAKVHNYCGNMAPYYDDWKLTISASWNLTAVIQSVVCVVCIVILD
jgi:hypothetical protein